MQCGNFSGQLKVLTIDGSKGLIDKLYLFMKIKNINDITLFRYLFCLDKRELPQSILNWCNNIGSAIDSDRENAIRELSTVKGNCRNLVV